MLLSGELEINPKIYYFIKIIIILLIVLITYRYYFNSYSENFNIEGSQNIDSVFNTNNLIVGDLVINGTFNIIPKGSVVAWTKDTIPKGWTLCDGTNGTPDLRGRFIIGSGQGNKLTNRNLGDSGGEETHLLQSNEIPSHGHNMTVFNGFTLLHKIDLDNPNCANILLDGNNPYDTTTNPLDAAQNGFTTDAHNNMPPFFILYYIMKL